MLDAEGRHKHPAPTPGVASASLRSEALAATSLPSRTEKNDRTLLATRSGPDGLSYSLRWLVAPSEKGPDILLYLAQRDSSQARAYCAEVPNNDKVEFIAHWKAAFEETVPEIFEGLFLQKASATLLNNSLDAEAAERVEPRQIQGRSFFEPLGAPIESFTKRNGVVIRVYQDRQRQDYVVTLSGSASPESDCLVFRMNDSQHWRSHEPIRPLLRRLVMDSQAENETAINELIDRTAHGEVFLFEGKEPRSLTVAAALTRLGSNTDATIECYQLKQPDHLGIAAALANESVVKVTRPVIDRDAHIAITDLLLSYSDDGLGSISLTVGWRENPDLAGSEQLRAIAAPVRTRVLPAPLIARPPTSIAYDFDIRDLASADQITWIHTLIAAFKRQSSGLHGPLTQLIAEQLSVETLTGGPRMYESKRHPEFRLFTPDQESAIEQQLRKISIYFRPEKSHVLAQTPKGAVMETKNSKGDRLQFTVRPDGIEEIFLFPRETKKTQKHAIGYHLIGAYQLNSAQGQMLAALFQYFTAENGALHRISDRAGRSVGAIGAWKTHHYLSHYSPRPIAGPNPPSFAIVEPPTAEERCNQSQSVVARAIREGLKQA